jgi:alpha-beta hydrolase superfamily lysophospholipase
MDREICSMNETAVRFGQGAGLVGIVSEPPAWSRVQRETGVILLNAGIVHRVGPCRTTVTLARRLADRGVVSLRYDQGGVGDSVSMQEGVPSHLRFVAETVSAMNLLRDLRDLDRFLLIGSCSGAAISYLTALQDERVAGVGLVNLPGPLSPRRLLRLLRSHSHPWRRLLPGLVGLPGLVARVAPGLLLGRTAHRAPLQGSARRRAARPRHDLAAGIRTLASRGVRVLVAASEWDTGYDYYQRLCHSRLSGPALRELVRFATIPGACHHFELIGSQEQLINLLGDWVENTTRQMARRVT